MAETTKTLIEDEFKLLVGLLRCTCQISWFRRIMQNKVKDTPWKKFPEMWSNLLISLRHYYLSRLAAFFDRPSYENRNTGEVRFNLSLRHMFSDSDFNSDNQETIANLKTLRDKTGSHNDLEYLMQWKVREEDYGIDFSGEKIEALFNETFKLLNQVRKDYNYAGELDQENEEKHAEEKFDEWYKIFKELK